MGSAGVLAILTCTTIVFLGVSFGLGMYSYVKFYEKPPFNRSEADRTKQEYLMNVWCDKDDNPTTYNYILQRSSAQMCQEHRDVYFVFFTSRYMHFSFNIVVGFVLVCTGIETLLLLIPNSDGLNNFMKCLISFYNFMAAFLLSFGSIFILVATIKSDTLLQQQLALRQSNANFEQGSEGTIKLKTYTMFHYKIWAGGFAAGSSFMNVVTICFLLCGKHRKIGKVHLVNRDNEIIVNE